MPRSGGGTKMWCPECKKIRVCKAIPAAEITLNASDYAQRWHFTEHDDIQWFQRGRECKTCGHQFITGECDKEFLSELIELRNSLSQIKNNAEKYISESKKASKSLNELSKSLGVLRALKIYKDAET